MKMIENKKILALSTFVCLLPIAMYLIVYDRLPEHMVQQWGFDGTANWTMPRQWAIFALPLFLALVHLIVVFFASADPKLDKKSAAVRHLVFWIVPVTSVFANLLVLFANLGADFNVGTVVLVFLGLLFVILGNYLPKVRQNYVVGFRLPWTLHDADNWNKTHRLSGKLLILGGVLFLLGAVLPLSEAAFFILLATAIAITLIIPTVYSFVLYKKAN